MQKQGKTLFVLMITVIAAAVVTVGCGKKISIKAGQELGEIDVPWYCASASEFTISTADELAAFAEVVNGTWGGKPKRDSFAGKTVTLANNIDLSQYDNWIPIGSFFDDTFDDDPETPFSGTFDGGGFVISNLTINRPYTPLQGLFGEIENATIKNLGLENVNIRGRNGVGAVTGWMTLSSSMINCYSTGTVSGSDEVGGLAGYVGGNSFVVNSYSTATVISTGNPNDPDNDRFFNSAGGLVGSMSYYSMIIDSYFIGTVSGTGNVGDVAGRAVRSDIRGSGALNPNEAGLAAADTAISGDGRLQMGGRLLKLLGDLPEGGTLTGGRSRANIQRVIMTEHRPAFRQIYNWREEDRPGLNGTITVGFAIDESGKVTSVKLENSTVNDPVLENSVILRVRYMDFGRIDEPGDLTEVVYPFVFAPTSAKIAPNSGARGIPKTLEECYIALDNQLSEDVKDDIALSSLDDFLASAHFGLGMWIRNNWIHSRDSELANLWGGNPDSISHLILSGYYTYLTGIETGSETGDDED
ncbi:MAG: TonB family protein [Chitinispirillales bacterium]|jgi:TonB family protein|nr:TonB family protein [Chitinispirillales bacterium]